jgi:hypothetical protein
LAANKNSFALFSVFVSCHDKFVELNCLRVFHGAGVDAKAEVFDEPVQWFGKVKNGHDVVKALLGDGSLFLSDRNLSVAVSDVYMLFEH